MKKTQLTKQLWTIANKSKAGIEYYILKEMLGQHYIYERGVTLPRKCQGYNYLYLVFFKDLRSAEKV